MILVGVLSLAMLAGCSTGGSSKAGTSTSTDRTGTTTSSPPTPSSPTTNPADEAIARRAVLTLSDLPPGWTSKPRTNEGRDKFNRQLSACFHIPGPKLIADAADAASPDFNSPVNEVVSSSVGVARSVRDMTKALDLISGPNAPACFAAAFNTELTDRLNSSTGDKPPEGTKIGTVTVSPESFEALGDRTVAFRATIPVSTKAIDTAVYVDFIVVQQGRAGIILSAEDTYAPFPIEISASLLRKVLARLPGGKHTGVTSSA